MGHIHRLLMTFLVAMVPVIELRGAIPAGLAGGLGYVETYLAACLGNMLPVPIIILFVRRVVAWMRKISPRLDRLVGRFLAMAPRQGERGAKYELLGLMILVAIPLPGTGAWTGALIAAVLDIRMRQAIPAIGAGVLIAGVVVSLISYSAVTAFGG